MKKTVIAAVCAAAVLAACSFCGCSGEAKVLYKLSDDGTHYVVSGVSGNGDKLLSYEIPETYSEDGENFAPVTEIGSGAFYGCTYLSKVTIPDSVTYIANLAFALCGLTEINIPDSVTEIGRSAFTMCDRLEEIVIPESVQEIATIAFYGCSKVEKIVIKAQIKNIYRDTFKNSYSVGETVYSNTSLKEIYLPATLEKINKYAFDGNFYLTDIYFAGTEEQWNNVKFYNLVENSSFADGYEEVTCEQSEAFISNPNVHFNCNF